MDHADEDEVHKITTLGDNDEDTNVIDATLGTFRSFWGSGIVQAGLIVVVFKIVNVLHDIALEKLRVEEIRIKTQQKNQD